MRTLFVARNFGLQHIKKLKHREIKSLLQWEKVDFAKQKTDEVSHEERREQAPALLREREMREHSFPNKIETRRDVGSDGFLP